MCVKIVGVKLLQPYARRAAAAKNSDHNRRRGAFGNKQVYLWRQIGADGSEGNGADTVRLAEIIVCNP